MREPSFWWRKPGLTAALYSPVAAVYGAIAARRMAWPSFRAAVPVICIGNFTLGGSGKTPAAIAVARMLTEAGARPFCLSRGYGGSLAGPVRVDVAPQSASEIGDEALLLARAAPTIVARDRVAGAQAAIAACASVIVMDDGLQNPSLAKDLTIGVVDGRRGIGNGKVFPAGPLRAPLEAQLARVDVLLIVGEAAGATDIAANAKTLGLPALHARLVPDPAAITALKDRKVLAFAGIGDPEKFFTTVKDADIAAPVCKAFADHHPFTGEEAAALVMQAEHDGLSLLTTEKDQARLGGNPMLAALAAKAHTLPVTLSVDEVDELRRLVLAKMRK
ncbi:MAG: tetraacyldisaccharide 4'-kinase [Pseudolabrys sp.]